MSKMFNFFQDFTTYEQRKVARFEQGPLTVSTTRVSDGKRPYETSIKHPDYNRGKWLPVEAYNTREEAEAEHERWVQRMTANPLPDSLTDCCNSEIGQLARDMGMPTEHRRTPCV